MCSAAGDPCRHHSHHNWRLGPEKIQRGEGGGGMIDLALIVSISTTCRICTCSYLPSIYSNEAPLWQNMSFQHTWEFYSHSSGSGQDGSSLSHRPGWTQPRLYLCSPTATQLWHSSHGGWRCTEGKRTANSSEGI